MLLCHTDYCVGIRSKSYNYSTENNQKTFVACIQFAKYAWILAVVSVGPNLGGGVRCIS